MKKLLVCAVTFLSLVAGPVPLGFRLPAGLSGGAVIPTAPSQQATEWWTFDEGGSGGGGGINNSVTSRTGAVQNIVLVYSGFSPPTETLPSTTNGIKNNALIIPADNGGTLDTGSVSGLAYTNGSSWTFSFWQLVNDANDYAFSPEWDYASSGLGFYFDSAYSGNLVASNFYPNFRAFYYNSTGGYLQNIRTYDLVGLQTGSGATQVRYSPGWGILYLTNTTGNTWEASGFVTNVIDTLTEVSVYTNSTDYVGSLIVDTNSTNSTITGSVDMAIGDFTSVSIHVNTVANTRASGFYELVGGINSPARTNQVSMYTRPSPLVYGQWVNIILTYNSSDQNIYMYRNGVLYARAYKEFESQTLEFATDTVGRVYFTSGDTGYEYWYDEMAFWNNYYFTEANALWMYNSGAGRTYTDIP